MRTLLLLAVFTLSFYNLFAQKVDTVYFDAKWVKTDRANMRYYRIIKEIIKDKSLYYVRDFYNDGTVQMEGTYSSLNPEVRNGNFNWFFPNGKKSMEAVIENDKTVKFKEWNERGELTKENELVKVNVNEDDKGELVSIERAPKYKGGTPALSEFLSRNLKYPQELATSSIKGKVIARFVVTKEGKLGDPEVIQSLHPLLDAEAIRVIKLLKKWEPGKQNGEFVDVKLSISINFEN